MSVLWGRIWSLQVGELLFEGDAPRDRGVNIHSLAVEFSVKKSLRREPNEAEITLWNLGPTNRAAIAAMEEDAATILKVGYQDTGLEQIFAGDLRSSPSERDGPQVKVTLEGSDGGTAYRTTRIQRSFAPGVEVYTVLSAAVDALGIGRGNLSQFRSQLSLTSTGSTYPGGTTLSGPAREEVNRIVRGCGGTWSIQNGVFKLRIGAETQVRAIELSPETGLIGSPTQATDRGTTTVTAKALMIPDMYPGRLVELSSREVTGNYEIHRTEYTGETRGAEWGGTLEMRPY